MHAASPSFDEAFYLSCWWDVKEAVRTGEFYSGHQHWLAHGKSEGRCWKEVGSDVVRGARLPPFLAVKHAPAGITQENCPDYRHRGFSVKTFSETDLLRDRLREEIIRLECKKVVEIGVFGGANLLHLADLTHNAGLELTGIDPWEKATTFNGIAVNDDIADMSRYFLQLRRNLEIIIEALQYKSIALQWDFSQSAYDKFADGSIDFLYVDGDHSAEAVTRDLSLFWSKVRTGGTVWGDDYDWPEVREAAGAFADQNGLKLNNWRNQYILQKS